MLGTGYSVLEWSEVAHLAVNGMIALFWGLFVYGLWSRLILVRFVVGLVVGLGRLVSENRWSVVIS